ncbi:uncharacterized protein TNCV_2741241 [Trichonephila clavipes]|nr:uncharacterized protein TNCV_2741241 [Trichonephila clavipes]
MLKTTDHEQPTSHAVSEIFALSLRAITIRSLSNSLRLAAFPFSLKIKCKNDSLPSPAAVKYHSLLITQLPRHADEFIEQYGGVHIVLAQRCIRVTHNLQSLNFTILK